MNKLIMFDINGTLIKRDARTDLPYEHAVNELLCISSALDGVNTSARSDKDVLIEILEKNGIEFTDSLWDKFLVLYKKHLEAFKDTDVWRENSSAVSFVKSLYRKHYPMVLITGELSIGAEYKLSKLGIWDCFATGGYGEDGLKRFDIAETALRKANEYFSVDFKDITIIGDTILDIKTARHLNAEVISITTGSNTREELSGYNPDIIIDDFEELLDVFE